MHVTVKKWGNSVSVRIPTTMMAALNIQPESVVDIREESGRIIIKPVRQKYSLDELIAQVTNENRHEVIDFGASVGKEIW